MNRYSCPWITVSHGQECWDAFTQCFRNVYSTSLFDGLFLFTISLCDQPQWLIVSHLWIVYPYGWRPITITDNPWRWPFNCHLSRVQRAKYQRLLQWCYNNKVPKHCVFILYVVKVEICTGTIFDHSHFLKSKYIHGYWKRSHEVFK